MKKIESNNLIEVQGGCGNLLDFASAAIAGWGLAGVIVGGVAASTGVGLALAGVVLAVYCA